MQVFSDAGAQLALTVVVELFPGLGLTFYKAVEERKAEVEVLFVQLALSNWHAENEVLCALGGIVLLQHVVVKGSHLGLDNTADQEVIHYSFDVLILLKVKGSVQTGDCQ